MVACASITFSMIGSSTTGVKSVLDKSAIANGLCYNYDTAEAKRALLEAAYNSNLTAFSKLSNVMTTS